MARLRYNGLVTALGASLTSADTAVTFSAALTHSGGTAVPTITGSGFIPLTILDAAGNVSEIVNLTAYTSGGTTGTIARAQEGTTATAHSSGDKVIHGPTVADLRAVGCSAYLTTATNAVSGTEARIALQAEQYDTDAFHDPTANPSRITIPAGLGGLYLVQANTSYAYAAAGMRSAQIWKNGVKVFELGVSASASSRAQASQILSLTGGDYLELGVYQDSSTSLALNVTGENNLSVMRLGVL